MPSSLEYNTAVLLILSLAFCAKVTAQDKNNREVLNMDSPFGVLEFLHWNHDWNNYKYPDRQAQEKAVRLMKEAGIAWVRVDFLWDEIEPEKGKFSFDKYDAIVDLLVENNINILGILDYCAIWASPTSQWNSPPEDNSLFVNYTIQVINRYKERIKYWEVWNEPDSYIYWANQDGLKSYCLLLKDVYIAAKKIDPDCKILNGGLANGLASVNRLYDNGAGGYFDILNLHIFDTPLNPGSIKRFTAYPKLAYKIMKRNNDGNKKIWVTETGCPGVREILKTDNWWMGKNPSERQQALWLTKVFTELLRDKHVEKIFWAFFRDCKGHWGNGIDYFGIVRWDFSKKPAFFSYQKCVSSQKLSKK